MNQFQRFARNNSFKKIRNVEKHRERERVETPKLLKTENPWNLKKNKVFFQTIIFILKNHPKISPILFLIHHKSSPIDHVIARKHNENEIKNNLKRRRLIYPNWRGNTEASNLRQRKSEERRWEYLEGCHSNLRQRESEDNDAI